ncbi:MAG: amidohydrolase family protein [Bryobacterales bacterium]|nr:amidohydrolase family protein [Bryobacterales bacterium]
MHPVSGPDIPLTSVLVKDGLVAEIGPKLTVPKGTKVVEGKGLHLYPGMIDSATTLGLAEIGAVRETTDVAELGDFNPQLRALVAVNPSSEHLPVARANGITSAIALPGGGIIAGQAGLMHLDGWTWEDMDIKRSAAMHLRFPTVSMRGGEGIGRRGGDSAMTFNEAKRRYDETLQKLRLFFEDARRYQKAKVAGGAGFSVDRKLEAMLPVLEGKQPVMVTAERKRAIADALDFAKRENLKIILAGCREFTPELLKEIKARGIPVILPETLALPLDEDDAYDALFAIPSQLHREGILFAFATFDSSAVRNLPYQAAASVPFGLEREDALKAVTLNAAKIWGVDDRVGSVDKGKWADLVLTDGDLLETKTQIKQIWMRGRSVDLSTRHTKLADKYAGRPD